MGFRGDRVRTLLKSKNKTQGEMAESLEYSRTLVSQWINGTRDPQSGALEGMARYLNTSVDYLLGLTEDPSPPNWKDLPAVIQQHFLALDEISRLPEEDQREIETLLQVVYHEIQRRRRKK